MDENFGFRAGKRRRREQRNHLKYASQAGNSAEITELELLIFCNEENVRGRIREPTSIPCSKRGKVERGCTMLQS
jgi:hypothetical protein